MVPFYGSPSFVYLFITFSSNGMYVAIASNSGVYRIKGMMIFK